MEKRDERLENETYRNEILSRMRTFSTPELCDGAGLYHVMDYHIKSRVAGKKIVGTAVTVDVPMGEGGIIPDAILMLKPGNVLVIAGKGCHACSYKKRYGLVRVDYDDPELKRIPKKSYYWYKQFISEHKDIGC